MTTSNPVTMLVRRGSERYMKKKEIAFVVCTIIMLFAMVANHIGAASNESKISRIADGLHKHNVEIDEWSLYAKKMVEKKSIEDVKLLTNEHRQYNWSFEQDDHMFKAVGTYVNEKDNVTEKLQFVTTLTNNHSLSYILYEVTGMGSPGNWDKVNNYFSEQSFNIFHDKVTTFTCVKGIVDDKMKVSLYEKINVILNEFDVRPVEKLQEQDFLSISGKTSLWEDFIPTKNGEMNIQTAIRTDGMGENTTLIIGTPIITSEY